MPDMDFTCRPVTPADKPRILEITSQVWEGEDYVPHVIDDWLAPGPARLRAVCAGDVLVGFARYDRTIPGYAWFEGMRTDPAWEGRGVAKGLMRHLLVLAQQDGVRRVGASTYLDNLASQHILETNGFTRVASFVYCQAEARDLRPESSRSLDEVLPISPDEALDFVTRSRFLQVAGGFLPHGWRFYPFASGPEIALGQMRHLRGVRRAGELVALLCTGGLAHGPGASSIDFLDGEVEAMRVLARHALGPDGGAGPAEAMVPAAGDQAAPALDVLRDLGFNAWNDYREDVFVYERAMP